MLKELPKSASIVEIGGGANPVLNAELVADFNYVVIDIDQKELNKAMGSHFKALCGDITKETLDIKADLIITNMLLEHIKDPKAFHIAVFRMLNLEGKVIHFFATKYSPASIVNMIFPEHWSKWLLYKIQNREWETQGKFPAYYRWCMGPTKKQISRFENLGFEIELYNGYLGSSYLRNKIYIKYIEIAVNKFILFFHSFEFCSNSIMILTKI